MATTVPTSRAKAKADPDADILTLARTRFRTVTRSEEALRRRQLDDKRFAAGNHWEPQIKREREANGDPCIEIDLLTPAIKQITNQQRAMRPSVKVSPVNSGADVETADVLQSLIRHIETHSNADDAYDQAGRDQATIGRGWFRILTEYADPMGEDADQEIRIARIRNPFSVYADPAAQQLDASDGTYLFETSDWLPEDLRERYPQALFTHLDAFESLGDDGANWIDGERIRVALYWVVSTTRVDKVLGVGRKRPQTTRTVTCYVITGLEILDRYQWAGRYIPYVPVIGQEDDIDGQVDLRGIVRNAKGPQRMFDYQKSKIAEVMALAPLAPWIVLEGQIEGYEKMWQEAGRKKYPYLPYRGVSVNGQPASAPQRTFGEPPIQAMMAQAASAQQEVQIAAGLYNATETSHPEMSGRAILARQQQGEHGNSDYLDGLARGIRYAGRILVDLIPKIYDTPRVLQILGLDQQARTVVVHAGAQNAPTPDQVPDGVTDIYDLDLGRYDVTVSSGPSYATQRQQFVDQMTELFKADPQLLQLVGDLYFDNLDIPQAKQIAERLRKVLPAALQSGDPQDPAALAAKAQQMQGVIQQLQQQLQGAQQQIQIHAARQQATIQTTGMTLDFQREKMERDSETKIAVAELGAKVDRLALFLDERARLGTQAHDAGMAALAHAHGQIAATAAAQRMPPVPPAGMPPPAGAPPA